MNDVDATLAQQPRNLAEREVVGLARRRRLEPMYDEAIGTKLIGERALVLETEHRDVEPRLVDGPRQRRHDGLESADTEILRQLHHPDARKAHRRRSAFARSAIWL